jgi:hypothetical protein
MVKHRVAGRGLDWSCCVEGPMAGYCECGNEPSGYINFGEFLDS